MQIKVAEISNQYQGISMYIFYKLSNCKAGSLILNMTETNILSGELGQIPYRILCKVMKY